MYELILHEYCKDEIRAALIICQTKGGVVILLIYSCFYKKV